VEARQRLRVHRVVDLVAERLGKPVEEIADRLLAMPSQNRYLLIRQLGRTGHSTVYGAVDQLLAREVALKLHHYDNGDDSEWRVLGEARAMSLVEHPNALRVFDLGEHEGTMYFVTELCDADMSTWSKGRPWLEVVDRVIEAGRGLAALHGAGYVHGDIKPANILVRQNVAKIADFGMVAKPGLSTRIGGTAGFIAPEVADGLRSEAGDVFALAATAWACLFGRSAFGSPPKSVDRLAGIMVMVERAREQVIDEPPKSIAVPRGVVSVLQRGLEPRPGQRPSLEQWLAELDASRRMLCGRGSGRRRLALAALGGSVLVAAGAAAGHTMHAVRASQDCPAPVVETNVAR
jgi:serine/threonine protein kinase